MSLIKALTNHLTPLSNTDPAWVTFVRDYTYDIRENSTHIEVTPALLSSFDFKLAHILRENGCPSELSWISAIVSDIDIGQSVQSLSRVSTLYIPDKTHITSLYRLYQTTSKRNR